MTRLKSFTVILAIFVLAACGSPSAPEAGEWVRTDRGDVYCLIESISHGYKVTTCDWAGLVPVGEHTTGSSRSYTGKWFKTERGEVYCLNHSISHGYKARDCDWSTLKN